MGTVTIPLRTSSSEMESSTRGVKDLAQPCVTRRAPWNQSTVGKAELAKTGPESTAFPDTHTCCLCEFAHTALTLAAP